jgi:hypothetical protein
MFRLFVIFVSVLFSASSVVADPGTPKGNIKVHEIKSAALADNKIGLNPVRQIRVYLPPSYQQGNRHYPTLYYIPQGEQLLSDGKFVRLLEATVARGDLGELIMVTGDFNVQNSINFFGNGATTGRWLDYVTDELVPFIDAHYRTLKKPESRGISGHFLGGYAAIKLAMFHPEIFGSVYALNPVATATGEQSMLYIPDWKEIHKAKSFSDLKAPYSAPFVAMAQAHLPNPNKPPFYADFIIDQVNGELVPNQTNIRRLLSTFHLAALIPENAEKLKQLRGIGYDWGRNDPSQAHVYGARKMTTLLQDYGLSPIAVEHGGNSWDYDFEPNGHMSTRMLPFFKQHLVFE